MVLQGDGAGPTVSAHKLLGGRAASSSVNKRAAEEVVQRMHPTPSTLLRFEILRLTNVRGRIGLLARRYFATQFFLLSCSGLCAKRPPIPNRIQ